jgi:hypothetical protein
MLIGAEGNRSECSKAHVCTEYLLWIIRSISCKVHFIIYRNVEEISRVIAPEKKVGAKI